MGGLLRTMNRPFKELLLAVVPFVAVSALVQYCYGKIREGCTRAK